MSVRTTILGILILMTASFLAGAWIDHRSVKSGASTGERKILHYVDPMHPSYTSDTPGIAPDCGMPLEPVYADSKGASTVRLPPGTVQINSETLQTVGVKIGMAEKSEGSKTLRLFGRVAADETRIYRLTAASDGWTQRIEPLATGDTVNKNQLLMTFYAPEFLSAEQALIYAVSALDRFVSTGKETEAQLRLTDANILSYRNTLRNLGMSNQQIDEIVKTRNMTESIRLLAPAQGVIISRNTTVGQKFERGTEFFKIADLSKIWIMVDAYGSDVDLLKPGMRLTVSLPDRHKRFPARVSAVKPLFDPSSKTLKVRLEANNPGYLLRPDMPVDVELPVMLPAMLSIPSEAVLDSGLRKTVFVEKSVGVFEPREVETGRSFGNRVEIISGLKAGERIAISGTFLLDSESRMKTAAVGITSTPQIDPACGMYVDEAKSRAAGFTVESGGVTRYFCSDECRRKYLKKPAANAAQQPRPASATPPAPDSPIMPHDTGHKHD
jgi:membrane fusion protein, copper/silver efflux system